MLGSLMHLDLNLMVTSVEIVTSICSALARHVHFIRIDIAEDSVLIYSNRSEALHFAPQLALRHRSRQATMTEWFGSGMGRPQNALRI